MAAQPWGASSRARERCCSTSTTHRRHRGSDGRGGHGGCRGGLAGASAGGARAMAQRYYDDPERWFPRYAAGDEGFDAMRAGRLGGRPLPGARPPRGGAPTLRGGVRAGLPGCPTALPRRARPADEAGRRGLRSRCSPTRRTPRRASSSRHSVSSSASRSSSHDTLGFGKPDPRVYRGAAAGGAPIRRRRLPRRTASSGTWWAPSPPGCARSGSTAASARTTRSPRCGASTRSRGPHSRLGARAGTGKIPLRFTTQKAARRARCETPWGMV